MHKIAVVVVILACAVGLIFAGCGEEVTPGSGGGETPVVLPARDTSTLESTLLGHWRDGAGNELYFGPDTVTFVHAETGEVYTSGYGIAAKDENIKRIDLEFTQPGDIFYATDPSRDMYATVFFHRPDPSELYFGAYFFSLDAEERLGLTDSEYLFVDTMQAPQ
jgi:hypothetical protein